MKRHLLLLFLIVCFAGFQKSEAQIIQGAIIGGLNVSQVDGDEVFGFRKYGANLGASAIIPIDDNWSVGIENLFTQKGAYQKWFPEPNDTADFYYKLNINYVEVPLLLMYEDRDIFTVGTGFSWGRGINFKEWEYGERTATDIEGPYSRNDFSWLLDLRFNVYKKIKFNFRYSYSLAKIRTRTYTSPVTGYSWDRNQYHNMMSFRIIYVFNEKLAEQNRRELISGKRKKRKAKK